MGQNEEKLEIRRPVREQRNGYTPGGKRAWNMYFAMKIRRTS